MILAQSIARWSGHFSTGIAASRPGLDKLFGLCLALPADRQAPPEWVCSVEAQFSASVGGVLSPVHAV